MVLGGAAVGKPQWVAVLAVCFVVGCVGCASSESDDIVDRKTCERLRDHFVDLRLRDVAAKPDIDLGAHRAAMKAALAERFVTDCQALAATQVKCGIRAADLATATACTASASK